MILTCAATIKMPPPMDAMLPEINGDSDTWLCMTYILEGLAPFAWKQDHCGRHGAMLFRSSFKKIFTQLPGVWLADRL